MRVTILGSGTSSGVPMMGCPCPVCTSPDPRNRRMRASAVVETGSRSLLIDTSTDLREQSLRFSLERVDAVLYTHAHADHVHGIDELRVYNIRQLKEIPCYGNRDVVTRIRNYFTYIFDETEHPSFRPFLEVHEVAGPFEVHGVEIVPVDLWHGKLPILGYRIGDFAYLTDVSRVPEESLAKLAGLEVLVLDALRPRPHATHFSLAEALEVVERLAPRRALLTHISHALDHEETNKTLPKGIELAYDGLAFDLPDRERSGS